MSSNPSTASKAENFKVICGKDNMLLRKNPDMNLFSLEYQYQNQKCDISALLNINMYNLLFEMNKDIIQSIEITPVSIGENGEQHKNEFFILFLFKEIGGDLGGAKKYMYTHTQLNTRYTNNGNAGTEIIFTSKSVPYHNHNTLCANNYKLLEYSLYIQKYIIYSPNHCQVIHMFKLKPKDVEELTVTMENAIGIFIKKMHLRLKIAIEQLSI
jgi:hypothetical protein